VRFPWHKKGDTLWDAALCTLKKCHIQSYICEKKCWTKNAFKFIVNYKQIPTFPTKQKIESLVFVMLQWCYVARIFHIHRISYRVFHICLVRLTLKYKTKNVLPICGLRKVFPSFVLVSGYLLLSIGTNCHILVSHNNGQNFKAFGKKFVRTCTVFWDVNCFLSVNHIQN